MRWVHWNLWLGTRVHKRYGRDVRVVRNSDQSFSFFVGELLFLIIDRDDTIKIDIENFSNQKVRNRFAQIFPEACVIPLTKNSIPFWRDRFTGKEFPMTRGDRFIFNPNLGHHEFQSAYVPPPPKIKSVKLKKLHTKLQKVMGEISSIMQEENQKSNLKTVRTR